MLDKKNAIITGARRGIGNATVEVFARNGANIWACARSHNDAFELNMAQISEKYNVSIWPIYFDVTDIEQVKQAVKLIFETKHNIDILVNAAGIVDDSSSFPMTSMNKMKHVFDVNFFAVTILTQYISRIMIRQSSGSIINIASIAGIDGTPAQYEYVSSKAAIIGATKELSKELGLYNIRVNAIAPGIVETRMSDQISEKLKEETLNRVTMKRMAKPDEIAHVVAFLASDYASYITGQTIRVDGGM